MMSSNIHVIINYQNMCKVFDSSLLIGIDKNVQIV